VHASPADPPFGPWLWQVQLLIFLQTVTTERKGAPPLSPAQHETCDSLRSRATELLCGVAPHGPAFAAALDRLGQGGGHYDRWLAEHPAVQKIGLAWDAQLCADLPTEPHDIPLDAVITPTRIYGTL